MSDTITCPKCKYEIEVTEVLSAQLRTELRAEIDTEQLRKDQEQEAKWQKERAQLEEQAAKKQKLRDCICDLKMRGGSCGWDDLVQAGLNLRRFNMRGSP